MNVTSYDLFTFSQIEKNMCLKDTRAESHTTLKRLSKNGHHLIYVVCVCKSRTVHVSRRVDCISEKTALYAIIGKHANVTFEISMPSLTYLAKFMST